MKANCRTFIDAICTCLEDLHQFLIENEADIQKYRYNVRDSFHHEPLITLLVPIQKLSEDLSQLQIGTNYWNPLFGLSQGVGETLKPQENARLVWIRSFYRLKMCKESILFLSAISQQTKALNSSSAFDDIRRKLQELKFEVSLQCP